MPLSKLEVGELSKHYEAKDMNTGSTAYKSMWLNEGIPSLHASLAENYEIIADFALQDKQNRELEKWMKETISKMYIWIAPEYRDYGFEYNWLKK